MSARGIVYVNRFSAIFFQYLDHMTFFIFREAEEADSRSMEWFKFVFRHLNAHEQ